MSQDEINKLSPLEKYSIYIGDYGYGAVREYQRKNNGSRAYWEGYCHAWSAVALDYPEPSPVVRTNRDGIRVPFGSADVKALLTANYAEKFGFSMSNLFGSKVQRRQVGLKCGNKFQYSTSKMRKGVEVMTDYSDTDGAMDSALEEKVREYQTRAVRVYGHQNGTAWIQQNMPEILDSNLASEARQGAEDPACLDTNAGAFHVIMANQLGIMKQGFIFDKTRDLEIWNQPAYKFESTLVGEEKPTSKSTPGTVSVKVMKSSLYYADDSDYGWAYYFPTLTSLFKGPEVNFMNEYNRYQQLLINQGDQTEPKAYPDGIIDSANYEYKLDLDATGKIIGGDWLTLDRPDFIWIMQKQGFMGRFSRLDEIYEPVRY